MAKLKDTLILGNLMVDGEIKNKASTTSEGVVKLNNTVTSSSTTEAATASAVKQAYDKGNHDHPYASTSVATTSANGLMSSTDKTKLDSIATGANNYTHPTTSGNKHIPSGGSSGQILRWSADGTAVWGADNNTTYSVATTSANGLMSSTDKAKLDGATNANTASKIVMRDASGNFSAGTITATLSGNASTATKLATSRTIALAGAVTGSGAFDGSGNLSITTTLSNLASSKVTAMTGYSKASAVAAIAATDSLNTAIGKLEKALDSKQASGSYAASSHTHTKSQITDFPTSLPANGGNADTVDGKHYNEFVQMPLSRLSTDDLKNANYPMAYRTTMSNGTEIGLPAASWYHIDYFRHLDNNGFGYQMAYPLNHDGAIYARRSNGTTWSGWIQIYDSSHKPTPADIGASATDHSHSNYAPAGYGLGTACAIPSGNDWNNALKTGFYMGSNQANAPNTDWWIGIVLNHHDGWVIQKVCNFNSSQQWMTRYKLNGTWTSWTNEYDRKIVQSTATPSGGSNGDIWIKYS